MIGVHRPKGQNEFVFTKNLDYRLFGALQQHSTGKPILVFCSTRKGGYDSDGGYFLNTLARCVCHSWSTHERIRRSGEEQEAITMVTPFEVFHRLGLSRLDLITFVELNNHFMTNVWLVGTSRFLSFPVVFMGHPDLAEYGIGVHHAGLTLEDRRATEGLYLKKILRIVIATSVRMLPRT